MPMPPPKKLLKMEKMREKGLEVEYPHTPWYNDNVESIGVEKEARDKRIAEGEHADLLEKVPADRGEDSGKDRPRVQRPELPRQFKFKL